jgi:hypothetical protein
MKKKSTMIYKTIHRKLKTEPHNSLKIGVKSAAPEE